MYFNVEGGGKFVLLNFSGHYLAERSHDHFGDVDPSS